MNITLSNQILDAIDTSVIQNVPATHQEYFHMRSGQEHYRMLIHLGQQFNNEELIDLGTYRGSSALALAQNKNNKVFSLDILNDRESDIGMQNVEFYIGQVFTDADIQARLLKSQFIFLDIDHRYTNEIWVYDFLALNNWTGLLVCDDIHLNAQMKQFWNEISHPKMDLTKYGHWSGTGAILFSSNFTIDHE